MRNLLGRLHARRLPELLQIAEAWGVPLQVESKGDVVGALYRAFTDPRTVRDVWDRLAPDEQAVALALAEAADAASAPTLAELAAGLQRPEPETREIALRLYRMGILAREGDDEPLPVGMAPRLLMPRELALNVRRIQDEMASGDLARAPLRVLIELLDDAELESAARTWGLRSLPGVMERPDLTRRLLRLVNDRERVQRVVRGLNRDAAAIWRVVRASAEPTSLSDAAVGAGLGAMNVGTAARLREALAELEGALLVWHAYRKDGSRWLFVPREIREPGEPAPAAMPELVMAAVDPPGPVAWRHPDALAWDLLTLIRIVTSPQAPALSPDDPAPLWLQRAAGRRFWFGHRDGVPAGYLHVLVELGKAEGVLAVDETVRPHRIVAGPQGRAWRSLSFSEQTVRLRERWLRMPRWVEGEPAGIVEVWGADWRGMRPRLLAALADERVGIPPDAWVTLESLATRIVTAFPALLGPSFMAATARMAGEVGAGGDDDSARAAALGDIVAFELAGPFAWFGLTAIHDQSGQPRAICLTATGAAVAQRRAAEPATEKGETQVPLVIDPGGEIALQVPTPARVWAISAFAEQVDLGQPSHYRLTQESLGMALAAGIGREQVVTFLERASRQPLPAPLGERLATWARAYRRVALRRAIVVTLDDQEDRDALTHALTTTGWEVEPNGTTSLVVTIEPGETVSARNEANLLNALRAAGNVPRWVTPAAEADPSPA